MNVQITWEDLISIKPGRVPTIGQAVFANPDTVTERGTCGERRVTAHYSDRMNLYLVGDQCEAWWIVEHADPDGGSAFGADADGVPMRCSQMFTDEWQFNRAWGQLTCRHAWVAGMMHVHDEDVMEVAKARKVECERCEAVFDPAKHDPWA